MQLDTISSLGLVSAVGYEVETACAALRAGIQRLRPLPITAFDPDVQEAPVLGATPALLLDGFAGSGSFVRLGQLVFEDLVRFGGLPDDPAFWKSTGLAWCFPTITYERFLWPLEETAEILEYACTRRLADCLDVPIVPVPEANVAHGHVSVALLLKELDRIAGEKRLQRFVVLATDSLVDQLALSDLSQAMRLKTATMPAGLCPGEAAAALLLQRGSDPFRSACGTQATIRFADTRPAPAPLNAEDPEASRVALAPEIGKRLAELALAALGPALAKSPAGDVIIDLNGEVWRSLVWGHASSLLQGKIDVSGMRLVLPTASFGEIGAVSAVAGICAAARSFERKYAAGPWALVLSISDAGDTGAILVETPGSAP